MTSLKSLGTGLGMIAAAVMAIASTGAAVAQESTNRVAAKTDWSVFVEESPKECWGVSAPKQTVNSRDGAPVQVQRGDILLFITYRPGAQAGEVSFTGGYPFAGGSTVELEIGGTKYNLFTDGEWAWSGSRDEDAKIVASLKGGSEAVLTAKSARGTQTKDTFSLMGFTAAMDEASKRCAG
ncbi:invasion associated locus B family protein [Frigidibacter sp. MR17.14]|uniref:invasion associated locus B family protein n=1 Tax=Frigidibacter sp. MR17.14 TaxID=3126509 RepID=UPI003012DA34